MQLRKYSRLFDCIWKIAFAYAEDKKAYEKKTILSIKISNPAWKTEFEIFFIVEQNVLMNVQVFIRSRLLYSWG